MLRQWLLRKELAELKNAIERYERGQRAKDHEDRKLLNRLNKEGRLARAKEKARDQNRPR